MDIYDVYNDTLRSTTEQIIELYHEFLKSEGREGTPLDRLDFVKHLCNPWGVLNGYSPDFDGVSGITRFRNDCVEAFCRRANYLYEHDGR